MKKQLTSLTLMLSCMTAFAHNNSEVRATHASAPDYTYDMNFTTLFLKPSSNLIYATQAFTNLADDFVSPTAWQVYRLNPHYNFAFDLGAQVVLHKKETVLKANWEHFLSTDNARQNALTSTNFMGPLFEVSPNVVDDYKRASGVADYRRDRFNITYGQAIEVGESLAINLFAGVSFNRLQQTLVNNFYAVATPLYTIITATNTFSGVGPEIGFDLAYHIHKGLNFVSRSSVDLITGTTKNNSNFASYPTDSSIPFIQNILKDDELIIVPVLSQKIGINYELLFRGHCAFQMEVGYFTQFYNHVFNTVLMGNTHTQEDGFEGFFPELLSTKSTSFALSGPYFKLEIGF